MSGLKGWIASEKEKISGLTFTKKAEYIWEYYKLWIIGIVSFLAIGIFFIVRITTNVPDDWFYLTIANTRAEVGTDSRLWQEYVDFTGYDLKEKKVEFNDESYFDYTVNHARGNSYYEVFVAVTDAGILDAVTMEPEALTSLGESGRLMDLNREECSSIREKYGDRFLYAQPIDETYSTETVPVGINISDSILMTKYNVYTDGCALGIGAYSSNIDAVEQFLDFIFREVEPDA